MKRLTRYRTFKRTANNFAQFAKARKFVIDKDLTIEEARRQCERLNADRTPAQIEAGTKYEFESQ